MRYVSAFVLSGLISFGMATYADAAERSTIVYQGDTNCQSATLKLRADIDGKLIRKKIKIKTAMKSDAEIALGDFDRTLHSKDLKAGVYHITEIDCYMGLRRHFKIKDDYGYFSALPGKTTYIGYLPVTYAAINVAPDGRTIRRAFVLLGLEDKRAEAQVGFTAANFQGAKGGFEVKLLEFAPKYKKLVISILKALEMEDGGMEIERILEAARLEREQEIKALTKMPKAARR